MFFMTQKAAALFAWDAVEARSGPERFFYSHQGDVTFPYMPF
jgi:hypothetical protein